MRFVPIKTEKTQGAASVFRVRALLIRQRTQAINALRGHLGEYGHVVPQGVRNVSRLIALIESEASDLPATARASLGPPPEVFRKGRDFAAWLGFTLRQHSTGGKQGLEATTRMGERSLRRLLIIGANSFIIKRHCHAAAQPGTWLGNMLTRKPPMLVRVALANKIARIVWAILKTNEVCRAPAMAA